MGLRSYPTCVLFGGAGFIGMHLARYLLEEGIASSVYLADKSPPVYDEIFHADPRLLYVPVDVRNPIVHQDLPTRADLLVNLAAVHREPGHARHEYFETNIKGAENVCAWAEAIGCERILFTSSISIYGSPDVDVDEFTLPAPVTPYGSSKLCAEFIHMGWKRSNANRRLVIVRPGVIFGPREGGNVSRMIRAVYAGYFFYAGNKRLRKAGGYVKELAASMAWALGAVESSESGALTYNFTGDPPPTLEDYVEAITSVAGIKRYVPNMPFRVLYLASAVVELGGRLIGLNSPINRVRVEKLARSNAIYPTVLREGGYEYRFSLNDAFHDWKAMAPGDWRA